MAGPITGITGSIAWVGTENAFLATVVPVGVSPSSFRLNLDGDDFDTTQFTTTGSRSHIKGLRGISGEFTGQLVAPAHGGASNGSVTFPSFTGPATVLNVASWNMDIVRASYRVTAIGATAHAFIPGTWTAGGTFSGYVDDTTAIPDIGGSNSLEPLTGAVFKYQEKGAVDNTLTVNAFTKRLGVSVSPMQANSYDYSYQVDGDITQSTPSAGSGILPNGAITGSAAGSMTLTASTGRTYIFNAFWTGISISVSPLAATTVRVQFQGSDGSLAIA